MVDVGGRLLNPLIKPYGLRGGSQGRELSARKLASEGAITVSQTDRQTLVVARKRVGGTGT